MRSVCHILPLLVCIAIPVSVSAEPVTTQCKELVFQYAGPQDASLIPQHIRPSDRSSYTSGQETTDYGTSFYPITTIRRDVFRQTVSIVRHAAKTAGELHDYTGYYSFRCTAPAGVNVTVSNEETKAIASLIKRSFRRDRIAVPVYFSGLGEQITNPPRF